MPDPTLNQRPKRFAWLAAPGQVRNAVVSGFPDSLNGETVTLTIGTDDPLSEVIASNAVTFAVTMPTDADDYRASLALDGEEFARATLRVSDTATADDEDLTLDVTVGALSFELAVTLTGATAAQAALIAGAIQQGGPLTEDIDTNGNALKWTDGTGEAALTVGEITDLPRIEAHAERSGRHAGMHLTATADAASASLHAVGADERSLDIATDNEASYSDSSDPTTYYQGAVLIGQGSASSDKVRAVRQLTEAEYGALASPDDQTVYVTESAVYIGASEVGVGGVPQARGGFVVASGFADVSAIDVQEFTTAGTFTDGWVKPANTTADTLVHAYIQQGGNGGGSGRKGAEGSDRAGGSGGAAGIIVEVWFLASALGDTEDVVVGAGGAGGAARTANSTDGASGSDGGASSFAGVSATSATGGGFGGSTTSVIANVVNAVWGAAHIVNEGARPRGPGGLGQSNLGLLSCNGGSGQSGGGAGGAWRTAANADPLFGAANGGNGTGGNAGAGGGAGVAGSAGTDSSTGTMGGGGGGGGGLAAAGGAGGWPGGGGGGGGVGINSSSNSGAGGAGAHGYVRITTYR